MWFSSGSVVGRGVWWFVGRLYFEICPDAVMLPVLLIQIWIISGQWLNLVSLFYLFFIWNAYVTLLQTNVSLIWKNTLLAYTYLFFYIYFLNSMFLQHFFFFLVFLLLTIIQYVHTQEYIFTIRSRQPVWLSPWLSPNLWQILYHKDFKTGV